MEFIEYLGKGLLAAANELMSKYGELPEAESLSAMESAVREMTSVLGQAVLVIRISGRFLLCNSRASVALGTLHKTW